MNEKNTPAVLTAAQVKRYMKTEFPVTLDVQREVTSTNTLLKGLAEQGVPEGFVLAAESQTAGRGRLGRSFHSPVGTGLYMSLLLRPTLSAE
ncbi:MAG: biotin--[Clostridia bacterium]|nr:biotin--[acetyl-CoA-carboxylase] ligase [Clostridia bacterium]